MLITFSHNISDWTALSRNVGGFLETFLEGYVDHVIYRDCIVHRRFFICCSLVTRFALVFRSFAVVLVEFSQTLKH